MWRYLTWAQVLKTLNQKRERILKLGLMWINACKVMSNHLILLDEAHNKKSLIMIIIQKAQQPNQFPSILKTFRLITKCTTGWVVIEEISIQTHWQQNNSSRLNQSLLLRIIQPNKRCCSCKEKASSDLKLPQLSAIRDFTSWTGIAKCRIGGIDWPKTLAS